MPLRVFVSYSHCDKVHHDNLVTHLSLLKRQGLIHPWTDRQISGGALWEDVIREQLEVADVVLLLVSGKFIESDFCYEKEMTRALERHSSGKAQVIPIIVDNCDWQTAPFGKLNAWPHELRPVTKWKDDIASAWTSVAKSLRAITDGSSANQAPAKPIAAAPPADPISYLTWLRDQHTWLDIRGMGNGNAKRMQLANVYTRLHVSPPEGAREARSNVRGSSPRSAERADEILRNGELARSTHELHDVLAKYPHAALVGDPGSGKTMFLRFVAQNLARANLGDSASLLKTGLSGDPPFPLFMRLSEMGKFLLDHPAPQLSDDQPEHFYRFLDHLQGGQPFELPEKYFRQRVLGGQCMLLLDGLDEVPGEEMRRRIAAIVEQVVRHGQQKGNRHLISCRTRAYQGNVQLHAEVATLRLTPFTAEQVETFVNAWARALFDVPGLAPDTDQRLRDAVAYANDLRQAIAENPSGATFTESPLMLTVLAVVHWNKRRLPEKRAELYQAAVEYLLESRREHSRLQASFRRECLQAVAMCMFTNPEGVQRTVGRREAAEAVQRLLGGTLADAMTFVEAEELHSGLLVSRTEGDVEFWHLTFQEYLAALELSPLTEESWALLQDHLHDDRWAEVVLLLAGCERRQGLREAKRMINRVLETGIDAESKARAVGLVGRILRDLKPYGGDASAGTEYEGILTDSMVIFEPGAPVVSERVRIDVGEALGQIAGGDPRLRDAAANRIPIPGGTFLMGAQKDDIEKEGHDPLANPDESPPHRVAVSDFLIGRFAVSVQEYNAFVLADTNGYQSPKWWSADGLDWRGSDRTSPDKWDSQLQHPNHPVRWVSYHEAEAYAKWTGGRLPTAAEWEYVARGSSARRYASGSHEPTSAHASFEGGSLTPAPVGIYPKDEHAFGVRDLAGNVWEWCGDWFAYYSAESASNPTGPPQGTAREVRGGSFFNHAHHLRLAYRVNIPPELYYDSVGFRVVWTAPEGP